MSSGPVGRAFPWLEIRSPEGSQERRFPRKYCPCKAGGGEADRSRRWFRDIDDNAPMKIAAKASTEGTSPAIAIARPAAHTGGGARIHGGL